ncbi:MAG: ATP-dependent DNA helicase RecG [Deltaproteobacteria bacterium]|nr:ATP-dependent DNA helicase RecG [Deltaproteobacteria bacterium]
MPGIREILEGIARPLEYATRNAGANLAVIRDLERAFSGALHEAFPHADPGQKALIKRMLELVRGFDALPIDEKKRRIAEFAAIRQRLATGDHVPGTGDGGPGTTDRGPPSDSQPSDSVLSPQSPVLNVPAPAFRLPPSACRLDTPIKFVKGVGPAVAEKLAARRIFTVGDALTFFPRAYEDRRRLLKTTGLRDKETATVIGKVITRGQAGPRVWEMVIGDGHGYLTLKWFHFNRSLLKRLTGEFSVGDTVVACGKVSVYRGQFQVVHPTLRKAEAFEEDDLNYRRIVPLYPKVEGITEGHLLRIMARAVEDYSGAIVETLPDSLRAARGLIGRADAVREIHFPPADSDFAALETMRAAPRRRLAYEEYFFLQLGLAMRKARSEAEPGIAFRVDGRPEDVLRGVVPFELTAAQKRALREVAADMQRPAPMNRLLQGDVGSGKTAVAFAAMLIAVGNGCQAAMLAPTEILAGQHLRNLRAYSEGRQSIALLTGAVRGAEREEVLSGIASGRVNIVVGTHAVLEEQVEFGRLGLAVIDEQHRFGVMQRAEIRRKGRNPDILVMTATPIPRTLAMSLYGDLDLSVIDELPPGRKPVATRVFYDGQQKKCHEVMEREIAAGRQCYVVYPLVEESEKVDLKDATRMADEFRSRVFPGRRVGLLHGRMKDDEKDAVMSEFKSGRLDILVSTTVIEVGVDVSNATVMVVEHAERFGLSQLHQLRGRVGRGADRSYCLLVARYRRSEEAERRLRIMEKTNDGFAIAEEDLAIRGPGEFIGTRQSGLPDLQMTGLTLDSQLLSQARGDAFEIVRRDPDLKAPGNRMLKDGLAAAWGTGIDLSKVG